MVYAAKFTNTHMRADIYLHTHSYWALRYFVFFHTYFILSFVKQWKCHQLDCQHKFTRAFGMASLLLYLPCCNFLLIYLVGFFCLFFSIPKINCMAVLQFLIWMPDGRYDFLFIITKLKDVVYLIQNITIVFVIYWG